MSWATDAHIEARRNQILDAAWACFARDGYHGTSMQDIAAAAGLSAGAIYRYFDGKEAVLHAINRRSQEMGRALFETARSHTDSPLGVLNAIGKTFFSVFSDPQFDAIARVNIELWPEILRSDVLRNSLRDEMAFWRRSVTQLLAEAQDRGDISNDVDPEAMATMFICVWEGLRHYRTVDPDAFTPEIVMAALRTTIPTFLDADTYDRAEELPDLLPAPLKPAAVADGDSPGREPAGTARQRRSGGRR